jgi:ribose 5-phosphate isomerase B
MAATQETIVIGSDHAGYQMKEHIKQQLDRLGIAYTDIGTTSTESTDYPIWAGRVAQAVSDGSYQRGIAICGAGIGASIAANRFRHVRAALCVTTEMARLSRQHNNANVLVLGGRITAPQTATEILEIWLTTKFEGDRHERRIRQLDEIEKAVQK